jgi:integrase
MTNTTNSGRLHASIRRVRTLPVTSFSAGANVKSVQNMLGHASAAMTLDTYADLFPDDLDAVADRLDTAMRSQNVATLWPRSK